MYTHICTHIFYERLNKEKHVCMKSAYIYIYIYIYIYTHTPIYIHTHVYAHLYAYIL